MCTPLHPAALGPVAAGEGYEVEGTELVHAEHDLRITGLEDNLAVGGRVEVLDQAFLTWC